MLFKKRLKSKAKQAFDMLIVDPSFMKNNSLKSNEQHIPSRRHILAPALGACGVLVLAGSLTAAIILISNKGNNKLQLTPVVEKVVRLENQNEILREYERNASFVFGGTLSKKNADGKAIDINNNLVEVDSSDFEKGKVGSYTIDCRLKSDSEAYVRYNVVVHDEIIDHLKIENYRETYYVGEKVLNDDVSVVKVMKSGREVHALPTEVEIDDSLFSSSKPGNCRLTVRLRTNEDIKANYDVEVKPLEEIDLHGDYAYELNYIKVGTPIIRAFNINGQIKPEYSSIHISGSYKKTIEDGQVFIESTDSSVETSQTIRYVPQNREMVVYSARNDRERKCFLMSQRDVTFIVNNSKDSYASYKFVAKNGFISDKEIDYFKFHYGGVYFDKAMKKPVTSMVHLAKSTFVYVGQAVEPAKDTGYLGTWYSATTNNEMSLIINETEMSTYIHTSRAAYTPVENENDVTIRYKGSVYSYDKFDGHLYLLDDYTGKRKTEYHKFDPNTQFVCTLIFPENKERHFVAYNLGESLNKTFVDKSAVHEITVTHYYVNNVETIYMNEPIIQNVTAKGEIFHHHLNDYLGKYGNYNAYWQITDNFGADREDVADHHHFLAYVENGVMERVGWLSFEEAVTETHGDIITDNEGNAILDEYNNPLYRETKETYFVAYAHFDDHVIKEFKMSSDGTSINLGSGWVTPNEAIWKDMPFIGEYESNDNQKAIINSDSTITKYKNEKTIIIEAAIVSMNGDVVTINCAQKDENNNRINYSAEIRFIGNKYQFTIDDITYYQK